MSRLNSLLKRTGIILGLASMAFFVFDYIVFAGLRPKMVNFEAVTPAEEGLLNWVGLGLLLFLAFCLLSLFQIARTLKNARKITLFSLFLVAGGVLSLLFIFADVALLSDIGKQYRHGLAQPEWLLLYPVLGFQFLTAIVFTYLHIFGFGKDPSFPYVAQDSNIFILVQYVGLICGLLGLVFSSLGFLFPRAWNLQVHTTINLIILFTPYLLAVGYWLVTKLQAEYRQWYDEKQLQDVGKSAFLTLVLSAVLMIGLFVTQYNNLGGVVSMLWLPLYLFFVLFLFSSSNLYFNGRG